MPPPMWQITQPPSPVIHHTNQESLGRIGSGRQRAFTTTDRLPILSTFQPPIVNVETQDYFTYLSAHQQQHLSSAQDITPEIAIPEIRLAPPNNEDRIPLPKYINVQQISRSRGNSTLSLAPPSSILSAESIPFFSARQSFESNSFDQPNITQDQQLHVPPIESNHYRHSSEYSFSLKHERWHTLFDEMAQVVLPTLGGWKEKSLFSKLSALAATPLVLVFTLTLPVAEINQMKVDDVEVLDDFIEEEDHTLGANDYLHIPTVISENDLGGKVIVVDELDIRQGWNKHVLMVQCIISTVFIFSVFAGNI